MAILRGCHKVPVFCLLSFLIKRDSPGPAFYRGPRMGKGDKPFLILEFRTMRLRCAALRMMYNHFTLILRLTGTSCFEKEERLR
jgi:lipopolysaccharide/colanic/teichoic acid biosynthesis glycosyltransferase